jgi:hypothetical protein
MAWQLSGKLIEACSCESACPCVLGPAQPDQGWCSGALTFHIEKGRSEGTDLSGRTVLWLIDLPKDFASGNGTARVYVDDAADPNQRRELEAIFTGRKGGPGEVMGSLVSNWLSTETARISISGADEPTITVDGVGHLALKPIRDQAGRNASLVNAPVLGLIAIDRADLARSDGSRFAAPDMRQWESGGHGSVSPFRWSA